MFKIEDRVVAHRPDSQEKRLKFPVWITGMDRYDGCIGTVMKETSVGTYVVRFDIEPDEGCYAFSPKWLKHPPEFIASPDEFILELEKFRREADHYEPGI